MDDDLDEALKELTTRTGRSEADYVRAALRAYLPGRLAEDDHIDLREFAGIIDDDAPDDLASELDHYAYGSPKGHKRIVTIQVAGMGQGPVVRSWVRAARGLWPCLRAVSM
ncbi:MAG: ribbon-helix-helix protein, CopG family [Acidimicrobiales bacterium]